MTETVAMVLALFEKAAVIATAAFLLSLVRPFQRVIISHWSTRRTVSLVIVFSLISISGSHLGVQLGGVNPNNRAIGILVAGLIGGPWVGATVGLLGGGYFAMVVREGGPLWPYLMLASVFDGVLAGLVSRGRPAHRIRPLRACGLAMLIQAAHLLLIGLTLLVLEPAILEAYPKRFVPLGPELLGNSLGVGLFVLILRTALRATEREVQLSRQQAAMAKARFQALQAQIRPHFLYNTLNTVAYLVRTQPEEARRVLNRLAAFYRHTLRVGDDDIPLEEELSVIESYLAIERARFGDRLEVSIDASSEARATSLPPLLLQPLVENAVKHGISPREEGGHVHICAQREPGFLVVEVLDDGIGYQGQEHGVGLSNVEERLAGLSQGPGSLELLARPESGTRVRVRLPVAS